MLLNSEGVIVTHEVITHTGQDYHRGFKSHKDIFTIPFSQFVWVSQCKESETFAGKDSFRIISLGNDGRAYFEIELASAQAMLIYKNVVKCFEGIKARARYYLLLIVSSAFAMCLHTPKKEYFAR